MARESLLLATPGTQPLAWPPPSPWCWETAPWNAQPAGSARGKQGLREHWAHSYPEGSAGVGILLRMPRGCLEEAAKHLTSP